MMLGRREIGVGSVYGIGKVLTDSWAITIPRRMRAFWS